MESNFQTVLVEDPRLLVTDQVKYAVVKGAQNITQAQFNANSASMSQILFNIAVPSENTIIDRRLLITSTVNFIITVNNVGEDEVILNLGGSDALGCFPLHSLFSTLSSTINNTTVSCNVADILQALLLMNEKDELYKWHGTTPSLPDSMYLTYNNFNEDYTTPDVGGYAMNNVLASFIEAPLDNKVTPRGSFPITVTNIVNTTDGTSSTNMQQLFSAPADGNYQVYCTVTLTEPLLLSPFLFNDPVGSPQGFYGIQNFTVQANIGSPNKFWSTANPNLSVALNPTNTFQNTKLIMTFLTPQPSQLLKSRNVIPYYSLPRYISTAGGSSTISSMGPSSWSNTTTNLGSVPGIKPSTQTLQSSSIQLSMIPDKLIIFVRPQLSTQTPQCSNAFLVINSINLQFNNSAGLLSSFSQYDLWRISVKNGSNQSWGDFCGWQMAYNQDGYFPTPTCGSLLILQFGEDIQLNDWLSCGSLGSFNVQFQINVTNQSTTYTTGASDTITTGTTIGFPAPAGSGGPVGTITPELVLVTLESGLFCSNMGTSSTFLGILSKQDVLDASMQSPYTRHDVDRLIGGSIHDKLKSSIGYLLHRKGHHHAHRHHKTEEKGGSLGAAVSGGSIGDYSGGSMHHHRVHKHIK